MICTSCGDQAIGKLCAHCGAVLEDLREEAGLVKRGGVETVEQFLARGGHVVEVPMGASRHTMERYGYATIEKQLSKARLQLTGRKR